MKYLSKILDWKLYQSIFFPIRSNMFFLLNGQFVIVIDPCIDEEAEKLFKEQHIQEALVLLTHEHYDHVSGVNWLREQMKCEVWAHEICASVIEKQDIQRMYEILLRFHKGKDNMEVQPTDYHCKADCIFNIETELIYRKMKVVMMPTPGHSPGSSCYLLNGNLLFSGDSLVNGFPTITRLPGGSRKDYENVTKPYLLSLDKNIIVYPGHGDSRQLKNWDF